MFVSLKVLFQLYIAFLFEVPLEREIDYAKENNVWSQAVLWHLRVKGFLSELMAFLPINLAPNTFGVRWQ